MLYLFATALSALYASLDPTSIAQHLAFYELYPDTPEGKKSLSHAWELLSGGCESCDPARLLPKLDVRPFIEFVNRVGDDQRPQLTPTQLEVIEKLGSHLANRKLKGHAIWSLKELLSLPPHEVDLARGLFLAELEADRTKIQSYEAALDLMALQVEARLSPNASHLDKVRAINAYVFEEMRFRFPPQSLFSKEIDVYTLLPSVLDSRRGVCLGVSILYLCLAQRLDLPLEAITPPGHIYVRYKGPEGEIVNIETTARGIDTPSEVYLGIETRALQERTIKEVIGLAFMNQAAVAWHKHDSKRAIALYERAEPFLQGDYLLNLFLGLNYIFDGQHEKGKERLKRTVGKTPPHMISADTSAEDLLAGKADSQAIQAVYQEIEPTRASIIAKQKELEKVVATHPEFRQGLYHLAVTWLQLSRYKEALPILERYVALNPQDPSAHYYLAAIHFERKNYPDAWKYLKKAEAITHAKQHHPRALTELRQALTRACPDHTTAPS
jgi:regulator of sirC expression with transglutaminase-like and TPR domain